MHDLSYVKDLYSFNRWANDRVLGVVEHLSPEKLSHPCGGSFSSIRDTLAHILGAEWIWLERWRGTSPTSFPDAQTLPTIDAFKSRWFELQNEQFRFLESLDESKLQAELAYTNLRGQFFATPLWQQMVHVVNHSTYHRGQITTLLRQFHAEPVSTDLIRYFLEETERRR